MSKSELTPREQQVIAGYRNGLLPEQISDLTGITRHRIVRIASELRSRGFDVPRLKRIIKKDSLQEDFTLHKVRATWMGAKTTFYSRRREDALAEMRLMGAEVV